jgi:flotillin
MVRFELEKARGQADIVAKAQIAKEEAEIAAEAQAEVMRRKAKGEADSIFAKLDAQARGAKEILEKQAEGMQKLIAAAGGNADAAVKLMIADKLEDLTKIQTEAIKNIKIDKVTVWDSGSGNDGKTSTADFISGIAKSVPPLQELFKQSGLVMPGVGEISDAGSHMSE